MQILSIFVAPLNVSFVSLIGILVVEDVSNRKCRLHMYGEINPAIHDGMCEFTHRAHWFCRRFYGFITHSPTAFPAFCIGGGQTKKYPNRKLKGEPSSGDRAVSAAFIFAVRLPPVPEPRRGDVHDKM